MSLRTRLPAESRPIRFAASFLALLSALHAAGAVRAEPAADPKPLPAAPLPLTVSPSAQETAPAQTAPAQAAPQVAPAQPAPASAAQTPKKSRELPPTVYAQVSEDPVPTLSPATFLATMKLAEHYKALSEAGGWGMVPAGLSLKPGDRNPAVASLRGHLVMTGDLAADAAHSDLYDAPLVAAVKAFQQRHGLPESGLVGRLTVNALNVPASVRHHQLAASAQRLMGSAFPFGERYVVVNIPSATVEAVEKERVVRRYVAVVGKPDKATPSVETRITDINLNPTWTVPVSVIKNEIIPTMRKNPGYLAKNHIRMLGPGGTEVDPTTIDWNTERAANYTLRQDPGFDNSLGQVRIDMPNRYAVYMHDTPSKSLFAGNVRFHSHGCVRVGQVKEFAAWLLQGTEGPNGPGSTWGPIEIETGIATGERRDVKLAKPVPVTFVYLTGYGTPDGRAHFRDDIYGLDTPATPTQSVPVQAAPTQAAPAQAAATDVTATGTLAPRPAARVQPGAQPKNPISNPIPNPVAREAKPTGPATVNAAKPPQQPAPRGEAPKRESAKSDAPKPETRRPASATARDGAPRESEPVPLPPGLVGGRG